jgi:hypothetical protein
MNDRGESIKIANISLNTKPNLKSLQILRKWFGRNPFLKKEAKSLVGLSLYIVVFLE